MQYEHTTKIFDREVLVTARFFGPDLLVTVTGGDRAHLGVVTAGTRLEPLQTAQLQTHKEFYITESWGVRLRNVLTGNFFITSGVHFDGLTKPQLVQATSMLEELVEDLIRWLEENK